MSDKRLTFEHALLRLNDMIDHNVEVRVGDPDFLVLITRGTLTHDTTQGAWGYYRVGDSELDLHTFSEHNLHVEHTASVHFMLPRAELRVDISDLDARKAKHGPQTA